MSDTKAARELITRALVDLKALEELVENPRVADEIFGFLAQQAAEKSLKAWLALLGKQYPITHNLDQLLQELKKNKIEISAYGDLGSLNPYAVQFRYESLDSSEPDLDRQEVLQMTGALVEKVCALASEITDDGPTAQERPAVYRSRLEKNRKTVKSKKKPKKRK